jgi:hypothetical protein
MGKKKHRRGGGDGLARRRARVFRYVILIGFGLALGLLTAAIVYGSSL